MSVNFELVFQNCKSLLIFQDTEGPSERVFAIQTVFLIIDHLQTSVFKSQKGLSS